MESAKRDFSTNWKWIGDFQLGSHVYSVWERYDENFRRRYAITEIGTYPLDEGQPGPKYLVIQKFCEKKRNAKFYWVAWPPKDPDSIHCW